MVEQRPMKHPISNGCRLSFQRPLFLGNGRLTEGVSSKNGGESCGKVAGRSIHIGIGHVEDSGKEIDLHLLYWGVTKSGGLEKVILEKRLREVVMAFSFPPTTTSASFVLRNHYLNLLRHYEQVYFFGAQGADLLLITLVHILRRAIMLAPVVPDEYSTAVRGLSAFEPSPFLPLHSQSSQPELSSYSPLLDDQRLANLLQVLL